MMEFLGFQPSLEWLSQDVPLWFSLLMAFTSPYLWSQYVKRGVRRAVQRYTGSDE